MKCDREVSLRDLLTTEINSLRREMDKTASQLIEANRLEFVSRSEHEKEMRQMEKLIFTGSGILGALTFILRFFIR